LALPFLSKNGNTRQNNSNCLMFKSKNVVASSLAKTREQFLFSSIM
jgi:hypothetical protein